MKLLPVLLLTVLPLSAQAPPPQIFPASQIRDAYRVLLDRDAPLLESINSAIQQNQIRDGEVLVTAGSVQECTFHYVGSTAKTPKNVYKTVKGPYEILNAGGIIADGVPHIHITLSTNGSTVVGGHLENGCKVLYLAEITIFKYSGTPLTRKDNANGVSMLQAK